MHYQLSSILVELPGTWSLNFINVLFQPVEKKPEPEKTAVKGLSTDMELL